MEYRIRARTASHALEEAMFTMPLYAVEEKSRNGPVFTIPEPATLVLINPDCRVIIDPIRDANPFFHLFEALWMFAGDNDAKYPAEFLPGYMQYAEDDGRMHGAYGHRWIEHFGVNQIMEVIRLLREDPSSRQAVISMWDPIADLGATVNDRPCNTHIYFRVCKGALHMTVCNRSNDIIWGMLGANIIHFTMLQELIATAIGQPLGTYTVFTNNLHIYPELVKNFKQLWGTQNVQDVYNPSNGGMEGAEPMPLIDTQQGETYEAFTDECTLFVHNWQSTFFTRFMSDTAKPMRKAWEHYKKGQYRVALEHCRRIDSEDWRIAASGWLNRRIQSKS